MPKLVHATPRYRKHAASGLAVVTLNGRDHYLGPWRSKASKAEYDRLIAEWLAKGRHSPSDQLENDLTVTELVVRYWRHAKGYYVKNGHPTGALSGIKVALRRIRQSYGHTPAANFGPLALQVLQTKMVESGLSRPYINEQIAHIKRAFRWAVAQQLVPASLHQALTAVPGLKKGRTTAREPDPIGPVSDDVVDTTLPHLPAVVADMVRFQRLVGCRPSEVCLIRPCNVDRSGEVWCYVPESHKTEHRGRQRRIYIGPRAQKVLLPYLLRDAETYCFCPAESQRKRYAEMRANRKTPVQPAQINRSKKKPQRAPGDHYTKDSYNRAIRRAVDKVNRHRPEEDQIPYWHPNQLRHSVGTVVRKEFGIEAAQVTLGHARADVTQVYAERDFELAKETMKKIG
jgi:integrase